MKLSAGSFSPVSVSSSPRYSRLHQRKQPALPFSQQQSTLARRAAAKLRRSLTRIIGRDAVPHGCIPIYVGDQVMKRFIVSIGLLNVPVIVQLLDMSSQEHGYQQGGALHIACDVLEFERVLEAVGRDMALDPAPEEEEEQESNYEEPQ